MRARGIALTFVIFALGISSGCTNTSVRPEPTIEIEHLTAASVQLTAPFGWATYEWSFGDGSTAFGRVQEHAYDEPGDYTIDLKALDIDGPAAFAHRVITVHRDIYVSGVQGAAEDDPTFMIQPAVDSADAGDWIFVEGAHRENVTIDKAITLLGPCTMTSLTADPAIHVRADGISLHDIAFIGGAAEATAGGALRISSAAVEVHACSFDEHDGHDGAAIYVFESEAEFVGCTFADNDADIDGGAVYCEGDSAFPSFVGCTFEGNRAESGAAIAARATSTASLDVIPLRVEACTFIQNVAAGALAGGAIHVGHSVRTLLIDNTFSGNGPEDIVFE